MRTICSILILSALSAPIFAQIPANQPSPAESRIEFVTREIAKTPEKPNLYTELAIALLRRERETSDKSLLTQAQVALDKSFKLAPANLEAQKVEAALLLSMHEFGRALTLSREINENIPDDVMSYGYIADADLALGDYGAAEKAAQWMLDLRTNNIPGLLRGAELRLIFGDSDGALQFLSDAYRQTSPDQSEDSAWLLTRMAAVNLSTGKLDLADQALQKALTSFPNYYFSLEVQAGVRCARQKYGEAAGLLHLRNQNFPQAESLYAEAEAVENAGNVEKAKQLFANFEQLARSESSHGDNDNIDLVHYYTEHKHDASEALRIARLAGSQRHDVWTLDSLATALYANRDYVEAQKQMEKALAPGIHDANLFFHAAQISAALKNNAATIGYLKSSLDANPQSPVADNARQMLAKLAGPEYGARRN